MCHTDALDVVSLGRQRSAGFLPSLKEKPQGFNLSRHRLSEKTSDLRRQQEISFEFSRKVTGGPSKHVLMAHAHDFLVSYKLQRMNQVKWYPKSLLIAFYSYAFVLVGV